MSGNDNAFPFAFDENAVTKIEWGLTKRELFAAMAMHGYFAGRKDFVCDMDVNHVTSTSIQYADALIAALNANPESK